MISFSIVRKKLVSYKSYLIVFVFHCPGFLVFSVLECCVFKTPREKKKRYTDKDLFRWPECNLVQETMTTKLLHNPYGPCFPGITASVVYYPPTTIAALVFFGAYSYSLAYVLVFFSGLTVVELVCKIAGTMVIILKSLVLQKYLWNWKSKRRYCRGWKIESFQKQREVLSLKW